MPKNGSPLGPGIGNAEALLRMNFLNQAAVLATTLPSIGGELSRFYVKTMKDVAQKLVIRM
jgi:RNase P subunit RPR2